MTHTLEDLTKIGEASLAIAPYEFDLVAAWRAPDGSIYIATDSGCSCPMPFEWLKELDQLTGPLTPGQAVDEILSLLEVSRGAHDPDVDASVSGLVGKIV
jgi:hypothetical protein